MIQEFHRYYFITYILTDKITEDEGLRILEKISEKMREKIFDRIKEKIFEKIREERSFKVHKLRGTKETTPRPKDKEEMERIRATEELAILEVMFNDYKTKSYIEVCDHIKKAGTKKLNYPIKKHHNGLYYTVTVKILEDDLFKRPMTEMIINEMKSAIKGEDKIIRFLICRTCSPETTMLPDNLHQLKPLFDKNVLEFHRTK